MYKNLKEFITQLENAGELKRISKEVDPVLEITEIYDRVVKAGGPALLFEKVKGSAMPLLINAFGSKKRMEMALEVSSIFEIEKRLAGLLHLRPAQSFKETVKLLGSLKQILKMPPQKVKKAYSQKVILTAEKANLNLLPLIQCWPDDGGKFITLGQVITKHPKSQGQNVGMYRLQQFDSHTLGFHVHIHHEGARHYHEYKKMGKKMPVAIALGGDPVQIYSATAPLPSDIDEYLFAGFLRNKRVPLVKAVTQDLWVPADAEIIIEGYIDPKEALKMEGPFGDHTGYYSLADLYPVLHLTAITHAENPIYPTTVVGRPVQEDCYLGWATERIFLPLIQTMIPEVKQVHFPFWGVFHNAVFVSIEKRFPYQAQKVMQALWGLGQMNFTKMIFVFDPTIDIFDEKSVFRALGNEFQANTDLSFSSGALDVLDHASQYPLYGGKIGFDLTQAILGEAGFEHKIEMKVLPEKLALTALKLTQQGFDIKDLYLHSESVLVLAIKKHEPHHAKKMLQAVLNDHSNQFKWIIAVDDKIEVQNLTEVLFRVGANIDPTRDCLWHENTLGIDASTKTAEEGFTREWPKDIVMSDEIKAKVDQNWPEYGIEQNR